jgi:hypothetical protein
MSLALEEYAQTPSIILRIEEFRNAAEILMSGSEERRLANLLVENIDIMCHAAMSNMTLYVKTFGTVYSNYVENKESVQYITDKYPLLIDIFDHVIATAADALTLLATEKRQPYRYLYMYVLWNKSAGIKHRRDVLQVMSTNFKNYGEILMAWLNELNTTKDSFCIPGAAITWVPGRIDKLPEFELCSDAVSKYSEMPNSATPDVVTMTSAYIDQRLKNIHELFVSKLVENDRAPPGSSLETEIFKFVVRAQLVTSAGKADVYAAVHSEYGNVFVKGPYSTEDKAPMNAVAFAHWKRDNGLPVAAIRIVKCVADRWSEGQPLGARNKISRTKLSSFLVSQALVDEWPPKERSHGSSVWPVTQVLANDKTWIPLDQWSTASPQEIEDYVMAIFARMIAGLDDLTDRNFCKFNGRIYSIDEDRSTFKEVNLNDELKKYKVKLLQSWLVTNNNVVRVRKIIDNWTPMTFSIDSDKRKQHLLDNLDRIIKEHLTA